MNPEQQRIAIAEACGIVGPFDNRWIKEYEEEGGDVHGFTGFEKGELVFIPDYLHDLNAMHEAENVLMQADLIFEYGMHITTDHHYEHLLRATAAQRAEAFLKTIGKWEDDK